MIITLVILKNAFS